MRRLALCALVLLSCKPDYDGVYIRPESLEYNGHVGSTFIELPEGIAVVASVEIQSSNNEEFNLTDLMLDSQNRTVMNVERGDFLGRFVFWGIAPGNTCVEVRIDGDVQECIDASVVSQ